MPDTIESQVEDYVDKLKKRFPHLLVEDTIISSEPEPQPPSNVTTVSLKAIADKLDSAAILLGDATGLLAEQAKRQKETLERINKMLDAIY